MTSTGGSGLTSGTSGSGLTGGTSGSSGYGTGVGSSTTAGPHSSNLANKADPRVDSDLGRVFHWQLCMALTITRW